MAIIINGHKEINMVSKCSKKNKEYYERKKMVILVRYGHDERKRASICLHVFFFFFFTNAHNSLKRMENEYETIWSNFKFCTHTCAFIDLKLTGRILTLIMRNINEK